MIVIAHRGNLYSPNKNFENTIKAIEECVYHNLAVELDIWYKDNIFWLGHDKPTLKLHRKETDYLNNLGNLVYYHCKDIETLAEFNFRESINKKLFNYNYFYHETDSVTLTNKNLLWTYPGKKLLLDSICVLPELCDIKYQQEVIELAAKKQIYGICTDYPLQIIQDIKEIQNEIK